MLSVTGVGLIVLPNSFGTTSGLLLAKKVTQKKIINEKLIYKKQYEKDQQTIKNFDIFKEKVHKIIQFIKMNMSLHLEVLLSIWMKQKINLLSNVNTKIKYKFFIFNKKN